MQGIDFYMMNFSSKQNGNLLSVISTLEGSKYLAIIFILKKIKTLYYFLLLVLARKISFGITTDMTNSRLRTA